MSTTSNFANAFYANPFLAQKPEPEAKLAVSAEERIEPGQPTALAVEIRWDDQLLHVVHHPLAKGAREIFVGDKSEGPVDYELPVARTRIATVVGEVVSANEETVGRGERKEWKLEAFTIRVAHVAAAKPMEKGKFRSRTALAFWLGSAALHAAVVGALVLSPGESLDEDSAGLDKGTQAYLLQTQKNHLDREIAEQQSEAVAEKESTAGGSGKAHKGDNGQMGDPSKKATNAHYEIQGPPETKEVKMAKVHALIESGHYGAIGALASVFGSSVNTQLAFDSEAMETIGREKNNFMGNLTGAYGGDAFGYNGLGSFGTGPGGGGLYDGIGLGTIGDFGHSGGSGDGLEWGGGTGVKCGDKPCKRATKPIKMFEPGDVSTTGKLPAETIKRIIRANFPRFRQCYEAGLKKDPGLRGTVIARFIIDTTGATESASYSGGTLPDASVQSCVVGVYRTLSFPEPESGKVMVSYPIDFQND